MTLLPRAALGLALVLAGCESIQQPQTALEHLTFARGALDRGNPARARALLEQVDESSFREQDLARYKVMLAEAYHALEEYWTAFETLKDFTRRFPTNEFRPRAEDLEFDSGRRLAASGWSFLGLFSDLDDARKVLEHFIVAYPRSRHLPEALRILGEAAYRTRDFELAIERYKELAQSRPDGAWADLASFRIAMSHFKLLEGPDYDAGALERARLELVGYLSSSTKNEEFVTEAQASLARTLLWIEEKNLRIAQFYLTIGKPEGARSHLERVLKVPDARLADRARRMMKEVEALERGARKPLAEKKAKEKT